MAPQKFTKDQRLRKPYEFRRFLKSKFIRAESDFLFAKILPNPLEINRLGFTIPKKKIKLSYSRNLIKRMLRELFRTEHLKYSGYDIVITPKNRNYKFDRLELRNDCLKLWNRVNLQLSRYVINDC